MTEILFSFVRLGMTLAVGLLGVEGLFPLLRAQGLVFSAAVVVSALVVSGVWLCCAALIERAHDARCDCAAAGGESHG